MMKRSTVINADVIDGNEKTDDVRADLDEGLRCC